MFSFVVELIVIYPVPVMAESTERELYGDLRAITDWQKSEFLLYFDSSCIVITRSRKLARVMTSKSVVEISVLPTAATIILFLTSTKPLQYIQLRIWSWIMSPLCLVIVTTHRWDCIIDQPMPRSFSSTFSRGGKTAWGQGRVSLIHKIWIW
jgi:hypothetical protein